MRDFTHSLFRDGIRRITRYYHILVTETTNHRMVGSTNEWVLDNFFLISEQEKAIGEELGDKQLRRLSTERKGRIREMLTDYLYANNFAVDKHTLTRHVVDFQNLRKHYFSYKEVEYIHILLRIILISEIGRLTIDLEKKLRHPFDTSKGDREDFKNAIDSNVTENMKMMNLFVSLKAMSKLEMEEAYTRFSLTEKLLMEEEAGIYGQMYDNNKGDYRAALIRQAKKKHIGEHQYATQIVAEANRQKKHVGWLLFPEKPYHKRSVAYIAVVLGCTLIASALLGWALNSWWAFLLIIIPAMQMVIELFNNTLYHLHHPIATFKLKFEKDIPEEYATMVIMPTILKNAQKVKEMLDRLEVYYLSNKSDNLFFTLVGDASAEASEEMPFDDEVAQAGAERARFLNEKYGKELFHFVYRRRKWSEGERQWLGFERKRGAIMHYNELLLGHLSEEQKKDYFRVETISGNKMPPIKFVITLDTDTQLVLYSAFKLIGAMAHPLNRAVLSEDQKRVVSGHGLMQPRVSVDVEVTSKSRYAQLFAGLGGLDVYTTASFELYQDIFGEGSFCGKGIYDLNVFETVLKGAFPQNLILSHDLLEGCHVRCGLINDVEFYDDNPSNYLDDCKRHHRWTRGDWQIIDWLKKRVRNEQGEKVKNQVNTIGRWKIFDNLRRSVTALAIVVYLLAAYLVTGLTADDPDNIALWSVLISAIVVISPVLFFIFGQMNNINHFFNRRMKYYAKLIRGFGVVLERSFIQFAVLPKEAYLYTDALVRALYRMRISHRNLLNWITSEEAERSTKRTLGAYCRQFAVNFVCAAAIVFIAFFLPQGLWARIAAVVIAAVWCFCPVMLYLLGRPFKSHNRLNEKQKDEVREWAKRTWSFFDQHINEENNYLIPDNYQLNRTEKTDYKTSPTNIGYSLLAIIDANELGHITEEEAVERLEHVIDTVTRLPKWNGHLYNWYDIHTLEALYPHFVSTCDSGNFVASLFVVKGYLATREDKNFGNHHASLLQKVMRLIDASDFSVFYNHELDVFSIGYDKQQERLLPYHYNNYASEARLTSYMSICKGDAPYKHWFCLDKTLIRYKGYKGVASWYGTLFEYFMPLIFMKTYRHTLMDETYSFAIMAQRSFIKQVNKRLPWGISETAYHELDDAQNYKYHAFGVPFLKFQNTTPDRIVISPYSSLLAISVDDRAVYQNMQKFKALGSYDEYGFYESYDETDNANVAAHFAHHQGMILSSLTNYLCDNAIQKYFHKSSQMQSMEALLKEKVQLQPYIDMQISKYKRYTYSHTRQESDIRDYGMLAPVPEIGILSNGAFTVLLNDRGSGFSRYKDIYINRYRQISAEHYGNYMFIRDIATDRVWSNTYAPTSVKPDHYRAVFASDRIKFVRDDQGIVTNTEVTVVSDRNAELRTYTFENHTDHPVTLELTTYAEVIMCRKQDDIGHRVFNGMTVYSEYDPHTQALIFSKRARGDRAKEYFVINRLFFENENNLKLEYETSRLRFVGRGGSIANAEVMRTHGNLSNTVGTTLDPIMSFRRQVHLEPGQSERVFQLTGFGKSREQVLKMAQIFATPATIKEAYDGATIFNNMRISLSPLSSQQMALYNSISKYIYQTASLGRERRNYMMRNTLSQRGLWRFGISGDLPILLLEIDSINHYNFAKEMIQAFEFYKSRGLHIDLVIVNDETPEHRDTLHRVIMDFANQLRNRRYFDNNLGDIHIIPADQIGEPERNLLHTVARLWFSTSTGLTLEEQLHQMEQIYSKYQDKEHYDTLQPLPSQQQVDNGRLQFFNRYGGFNEDGSEYVITRTKTPMPWINVLTNPRFGTIVSSTMSGFTYAHNAQQFKLTSWSNDIVSDPATEMILFNHQQFVPTMARHGFGYSVFNAEYEDFNAEITVFVANEDMVKFYLIRLTNNTDAPQTVNVDMINKMVLGVTEEDSCRYLVSNWEPTQNTLFVRNSYGELYRDEHTFLTSTDQIDDVDIISPNRKTLKLNVTLPAGNSHQFALMLGAKKQAKPLRTWTVSDIETELQTVKQNWRQRLGLIKVDTPDPSFDIMLNGWYLYQTYSARLLGRVGFYQVGGATGYRDQLQDCMSVIYSDAAYARRQILTHAAHQFPEGDVLHWWHDDLMFGSRTTSSDDYLWLIFVTYQYLRVTGDYAILHEQVPFVNADKLREGEPERGMSYTHGTHTETLFRHLQLCIDKALRQKGIHGLPLIGCGDWNDGMNRIGIEGKGESVWVGLFLIDLLRRMEKISLWAEEPNYAALCADAIPPLQDALHKNAWDGAWYLRAYFDNGDTLGSRNNIECQIDLIAQAWALLTDTATPEQKTSILHETERRLVDHENNLIRLLTPAFKNSVDDPGYIMTYMEGLRENGGQYTHAAMWWIMALLHEHQFDRAYSYYSMINPINRTATLSDVLQYKVEPYCIAADIYSSRQHGGRGGWTWYTGSASWAYKVGLEGILGFHLQGDTLTIAPHAPSTWPQFTVHYRHKSSQYVITVVLDAQQGATDNTITLVDDGQTHEVTVHCCNQG